MRNRRARKDKRDGSKQTQQVEKRANIAKEDAAITLRIFLLCLIVIYLFVFFGGWKLFESGDPILIEVGVAFVLSFFVFVINEVVMGLEKRVKTLEDRINKLAIQNPS